MSEHLLKMIKEEFALNQYQRFCLSLHPLWTSEELHELFYHDDKFTCLSEVLKNNIINALRDVERGNVKDR
jgi:hypothetical protein